jgi:hypothetical protein
MVAKVRPPKPGGALPGQRRSSRVFRRALCLDAMHVTVFVLRALTYGTRRTPRARSARADAVVAAVGLSLAVIAVRRNTRTPVVAGLLVNTTGCAVTLMLYDRDKSQSQRLPGWWSTYLLIGGNAVSLAYLAAGPPPTSNVQ